MFVRFDDVSFHHREGRPILRDVRLELDPGWTGLVGPNGAGKSTLLALAAGALRPTRGRVTCARDDARVRLVAQDLAAPSALVGAFVEADDGEARRLRATLRLDGLTLARWSTSSPGERRRLELGAALWDAPDVLLCDEPDAHLDVEARAFLVAALRRHRGVGVLVSHGRDVLDALARRIVWLEGAAARTYDGDYATARATRERERSALEADREDKRRALSALTRAGQALAAGHAAADRARDAGRRIKGPRDHDGRSVGRKLRVERASASLGRAQAAIAARMERAQKELDGAPVERRIGGAVRFAAAASPARLAVVTLASLRPATDARAVLERVSLVVSRGTRARVAGPNGAGKSTLLAAIRDAARADDVLHLPQELDADTRRRLLDEVRRAPRDERSRWLSALAALGTAPEQVLDSACPSHGEAKKLLLARALGRETPLLLLDEPTNDLDLPSIERLEEALLAFEGAIVLVTHDDALAAATTTETWRIDPKTRRIELIG